MFTDLDDLVRSSRNAPLACPLPPLRSLRLMYTVYPHSQSEMGVRDGPGEGNNRNSVIIQIIARGRDS